MLSSDLNVRFARWWFCHMESKARSRLWAKLAKLMSNGVNIIAAMESMYQRRVANGKKNDTQALALAAWIEGMRNGNRLSQSLHGWASENERMLIAAGEQSGTIEKAMLAATRVMAARSEIAVAVGKGLTYPLILVGVAFATMYLFGFKVVPEFTKIVPADKFYGMAKFLIVLSDFARNWILWVMAGTVVAGVVFFLSLPRWDGKGRIFLDRYPPYSIYRIVVGSTWLIGMAALVESGVRLESALQQMASNASPWLRNRVNQALGGMRSGLTLGDALARSGQQFPDPEIIDDLGVYSALAGFDEALAILGKEWLTASIDQIKSRMAMVFSVSILVVALLVASMVGGMITMQMQMSQAIQQRTR